VGVQSFDWFAHDAEMREELSRTSGVLGDYPIAVA
jgi:hypothetical protein